MKQLPPFDALLAFDAVLRHGSMTAAAADLGVTQSAVSHRLRRLESHVGAPLLERRRPGLLPTPAGTALAEGLSEILERMAALRDRCRSATRLAPLRVGVGTALANNWLVRRLPAFACDHPSVEIELVVYTGEAQARTDASDLRVLWVPVGEDRSSSTQRLLFREQVFPVCHPRVLDCADGRDEVARLRSLPLLHKGRTGQRQGREWEWSTWFEHLGIPGPPPAGLRFEDMGTAIAAALEGAGVVLARSLLVHDALSEGRLVRPLSATWVMPSSKAHLATWPAALSGDQRVVAFVSWLSAAVERTVADVAGESAADSVSSGRWPAPVRFAG